jgi:hypothetical protein
VVPIAFKNSASWPVVFRIVKITIMYSHLQRDGAKDNYVFLNKNF